MGPALPAPKLSFPRRRESNLVLDMPLDSRLRGNDNKRRRAIVSLLSRRAAQPGLGLSARTDFRNRQTGRAAQGSALHRRGRGGLLLVTFLGRARKVTSRRAAPGMFRGAHRIRGQQSCPPYAD